MYPRNKGCEQVFKSSSSKKCDPDQKSIIENSKSQFYTISDNKCKVNDAETFDSSKLCEMSPVRPARGVKLKTEVKCAKLVDL